MCDSEYEMRTPGGSCSGGSCRSVSLFLVLAIGFACSDSEVGRERAIAELKPGERAIRIVLVTLDTLRFDSLIPEESGSSAMPLTETWARKGRVFERHYASSSTTQPTHASLLTGLHPWQHGVTRNGQVLDERFETVAEVFADNGFRTGAVVSSFPLDASFGFAQGFDQFDDDFDIRVTLEWSGRKVPNGAFYSLGGLVTEKAIAMSKALEGSRQFMWFHYFDMHEPYGDADPSKPPMTLSTIYDGLRAGTARAGPLVEIAKQRYLDDARVLDGQLDRLFRALYQDSATVDTHLLVVSDHGESFGEGGSLGHGKRLSPEQIRVPCFLISPGVPPARISSPSSSIDIPATLLAFAGLADAPGLGEDLSQELSEHRLAFGMRRTFVAPFDELRLDGEEHRLVDRVFYVADERGITTGNGNRLMSGPFHEDEAGRDGNTESPPLLWFRAFEAQLDRTSKSPLPDAATRAALEALGYVQ